MSSPGYDYRKDYYAVLGITPTEGSKAKTALFRLAKVLHPDKTNGDAVLAERFKIAHEAYEVLTTPELKAYYDRDRAIAGYGPTPAHAYPSPSSQSSYDSNTSFSFITPNDGAKTSEPATPQSQMPPEFRERQSAPYASTPSKPRQATPPETPTKPKPTTTQVQDPPIPDPEVCTFDDYYYADYTEKALLQQVREHCDKLTLKWRAARTQTRIAKHTKESMHDKYGVYAQEWKKRQQIALKLQHRKWQVEALLKRHKERAADCKEMRKQEEVRMEGDWEGRWAEWHACH